MPQLQDYRSGYQLPLSKDWTFKPVQRTNIKIRVGADPVKIIEENTKGWLISGHIFMNSPDIRVKIQFEGPTLGELSEFSQTPREDEILGYRGLVGAIAFTNSLYNPITALYNMNFSTNFPGTPWAGSLKITLKNEGNYDATVFNMYIHRILFTDAITPLKLKIKKVME